MDVGGGGIHGGTSQFKGHQPQHGEISLAANSTTIIPAGVTLKSISV